MWGSGGTGYGTGDALAVAGSTVDVVVTNAASGDHVSTLTMNSLQKVIDIKFALEGLLEAPAKYQILLLSEKEMINSQVLSSVLDKDGGHLSVIRQKAEKQDFVQAVRDDMSDISALRYMLANGADVNAKVDVQGSKPNLDDVIEEAKAKHLMSIAMRDASALHLAASHGHVEVVRLILEEASFEEINSLTQPDEDDDHNFQLRMSALHVAALSGHSDVCCLLLGDTRFNQIDTLICDAHYRFLPKPMRTALAIACRKGLPKVVSMLLKDPRCTSINELTDQHDTTILMLAACTNTPGHIEVCKMIMEDERFTLYYTQSGRSAYGITKVRGSAYDIAKRNGLDEIVQLWDKWSSDKPSWD